MWLFHYHFWTNKVEKMEQFYRLHGFRTILRMGKENGEIRTYNPPLEWDDFRHRPILFRIIELIRGQVNVTFGAGTRDRFDHFGLLVDEEEHDAVMSRARLAGMTVSESQARTFVHTPWGFRLELQRRRDVVEDDGKIVISKAVLVMPFSTDPRMLAECLQADLQETGGRFILRRDGWQLQITEGDLPWLDSVHLKTAEAFVEAVDPVGVRLITVKE
ncbi:hypothetical protein [Polycladomyces subterraneus]|uniref:VOC domain-containing protein n=1 Tax=Polycladomyces subterraneus TaxID=1016997 RepID=A0ABT8IJZ5_9BACL|nr:hypothetical protein [Polycladomyces subterraneus]MDN4593120.1 hypothetical protein [Polycladomyces subterraneus]